MLSTRKWAIATKYSLIACLNEEMFTRAVGKLVQVGIAKMVWIYRFCGNKKLDKIDSIG